MPHRPNMAAIQSLLNPLPQDGKDSDSEFEPSPKRKSSLREFNNLSYARKKQKACKDAAIFKPDKIRGTCKYPPYEVRDKTLMARLEEFEVYPLNDISMYPRHIPYNSEKKAFLEKTGREGLDVFQYEFKVPGDEKVYAMLWDYRIGLVRTTPLFKCTGHSKTTPAKMLNRNSGLREICHSITGGALVAQGYWMPFEAARAIATTFCWSIRHALIPIFGLDFPSQCIRPDSKKYGEMIIDPAITKRCTEQAKLCRDLKASTPDGLPVRSAFPTPEGTPTYDHQNKRINLQPLGVLSNNCASEDGCLGKHSPSSSPQPTFRSIWTLPSIPRSVPDTPPPSSATFHPVDHGRPVTSSLDFTPPSSPRSGVVLDYDESSSVDASMDERDLSSVEPQFEDAKLTNAEAAWWMTTLALRGRRPIHMNRRASVF